MRGVSHQLSVAVLLRAESELMPQIESEGGKQGWKSQFRQPAGCVDLREVLPSLKPQFPHMTKSREGMELMCRFSENVCKILCMSSHTWQVPRNVSDCHRAWP